MSSFSLGRYIKKSLWDNPAIATSFVIGGAGTLPVFAYWWIIKSPENSYKAHALGYQIQRAAADEKIAPELRVKSSRKSYDEQINVYSQFRTEMTGKQ